MPIITVGSGIEFDHATIQSAIDAANSEDVIQIADGTYSNVVVDKAITLEAVGTDVTITGPGQANQAGIVIAQGVSAVTITGITVNATPGDLAAVYAVGANSDLNFSDNTLDGGVAGHAFLAGGSGGAGLSGSTFSNNTFQGDGAGGGSSSVVYINGLASLGVASSGNAFTDNIISGAPTGGLLMGIESSSSTITGNTFSGTASYAQLEVFGAGSAIGTNDFGADGPAFRDGTGTYDLAAIASDNGLTPAYAVDNAVFNDPADAAAAAGAAGTAMDLATGNFVVFEGMSIQAAVTAAVDGDTVEVGSGTFVLPSTLNVDKGITLLGQGEASTTIDASALINSYGISSHGDGADGVAFEGFTLNGPANLVHTAYGLKISDVDGVSVTDVTVQGSGRTEVDLNGVTNATLTNVTANGASLATGFATPGVGFAVSSSSDVTFTDIATDGLNDWGGVALFAGAGSYDLDVSGIVFNGSFDVTEPGMIYAQEKNGKTATIDTPPFAEVWTVQNDTFRDPLTDSEEYTFFFGSQAEAEAFATGLASPDRSVVRDPDGDLFVAEGMSIQTAVDEAMDGDTITVGAGTFSGVSTDKDLTFEGSNAGLAGYDVLNASGVARDATGETLMTSAFVVLGDATVTIDGFRFENTNAINTNTSLVAQDVTFVNNVIIGGSNQYIGSQGAFGTATISRNFVESTSGNGFQINANVQLDTTGDGTATVTDNLFNGTGSGGAAVNAFAIDDFTFTGNVVLNTSSHGIQVAGPMGNVAIDDNTIVGAVQSGATDRGAISVNGVQNFTGTLSITGNTVADSPFGIAYRGTTVDSTANPADISGNDFSGVSISGIGHTGNGGDNALTGGGETSTFVGFAGADTFTMGGGDDTADGGEGWTLLSLPGMRPTTRLPQT